VKRGGCDGSCGRSGHRCAAHEVPGLRRSPGRTPGRGATPKPLLRGGYGASALRSRRMSCVSTGLPGFPFWKPAGNGRRADVPRLRRPARKGVRASGRAGTGRWTVALSGQPGRGGRRGSSWRHGLGRTLAPSEHRESRTGRTAALSESGTIRGRGPSAVSRCQRPHASPASGRPRSYPSRGEGTAGVGDGHVSACGSCPRIFDPVTCVDGRTYNNACLALCAGQAGCRSACSCPRSILSRLWPRKQRRVRVGPRGQSGQRQVRWPLAPAGPPAFREWRRGPGRRCDSICGRGPHPQDRGEC
jgi:hypothetical protein